MVCDGDSYWMGYFPIIGHFRYGEAHVLMFFSGSRTQALGKWVDRCGIFSGFIGVRNVH